MAYELRLPDLGEGLTEGEVSRWLVREGDAVAEGEPLLEMQTDKATVEIPSPHAGIVLKLLVAEGEVAPVGAVLLVIGEEGEHLLRAVAGGEPATDEPEPIVAVVPADPSEAVRATSAVRELARSRGVDLFRVRGTGPGGRVTEQDVLAAAAAVAGERIPVRGIRRAIVEQVTRTHREIPAVTFVEECDFTGVDLDRLLPLAIHVAARALRDHPELNARLEDDEIVLLDDVHVGVAVQTDDGLLVPVVRDCGVRSVDEIEADVRRLAAGARSGTLSPEDLRGSTITVTSAGRLGGMLVTPLINHPEVAILGLHRVAPRPVVVDGAIAIRAMGNVSVTFDHRVVDGTGAAAFCLDVIEALQSGGGRIP